MNKNLDIQNKFVLNINAFNGIDAVKLQAEKQKLFVQSHYPIDYKGDVELGLTEFFDENIGYTYGDIILNKAESQGCNTGSVLASVLLQNWDQIPVSWGDFKLVFPGTVWNCPDYHRGLTVFFKEDGKWTFTLVGIDSFPSFPNSRFVYDCRPIKFPTKIELKK